MNNDMNGNFGTNNINNNVENSAPTPAVNTPPPVANKTVVDDGYTVKTPIKIILTIFFSIIAIGLFGYVFYVVFLIPNTKNLHYVPTEEDAKQSIIEKELDYNIYLAHVPYLEGKMNYKDAYQGGLLDYENIDANLVFYMVYKNLVEIYSSNELTGDETYQEFIDTQCDETHICTVFARNDIVEEVKNTFKNNYLYDGDIKLDDKLSCKRYLDYYLCSENTKYKSNNMKLSLIAEAKYDDDILYVVEKPIFLTDVKTFNGIYTASNVYKYNNYNTLVKENVTLDSNDDKYLNVFLTENSNELSLFRHKFIKNIDGSYRWISTESIDNFKK